MGIDLHRRFGPNGTMKTQPSPNRIQIPPQIEAEMTPAVKASVEAAFAKFEQSIAELENQVRSLADQIQQLTPRNSSVPPSTEYPRAKPKRMPLPRTKRKQGG